MPYVVRLLFVLVLSMLWLPAIATASKTMVVDMGVADTIKVLEIPVSADKPTMLYFPHLVDAAYVNLSEHFEIERIDHIVSILPQSRASSATATIITNKWHIGVAFTVVDSTVDSIEQVVFRDVDRRIEAGRALFYQPVLRPLRQPHDKTPTASPSAIARIDVLANRRVYDDLYYQVEITHAGPAPLEIDADHVDAFLDNQRVDGARVHVLDVDGATVRYSGDRATVLIEPGTARRGWLWLPDAADRAAAALSARLYDVTGQHELKVVVPEWEIVDERRNDIRGVDAGGADPMLTLAGAIERFEGPNRAQWNHGHESLSGTGLVAYGRDIGLLKFELENRGPTAINYTRISVHDDQGNEYTQHVRLIESSATDVHGPATDDLSPTRRGGSIGPGRQLVGVASFRAPLRLAETGVVLALYRDDGMAPAVIEFRPKVNKGRNTVLGSAGFGGMQLARGDDIALVGAWAVGVQYSYGVTKLANAEVGFSRVMSGNADIAGVEISETFYQVQIGGRLLFKEEGWVPFFRGGVGLALIAVTEDDETSLGGRPFGQVGAGVIRWLDEAFVISAEGTLHGYQGGGWQSMVNVAAGVAWGGNRY